MIVSWYIGHYIERGTRQKLEKRIRQAMDKDKKGNAENIIQCARSQENWGDGIRLLIETLYHI